MAIIEHLIDDYQEFAAAEVAGDTIGDTWSIDDNARADWALRKIAQARRNIEWRRKFAAAEIERLERWQEAASVEDVRSIQFFEVHLRAYFEAVRPTLGKRKTYTLPSGALAARSVPPKFVRDDARLLAWAKATGDPSFVQMDEKPVWSEIKKRASIASDGKTVVLDTGEVVDGVTAAGVGAEVFDVKTTEVDS